MAVKSADQITIIDVTDAYSVMLTSEAFVFTGNTSGIPAGSTCKTQAVAFCGTNVCQKLTIGSIVCPSGISATIANNGTASPEVTFSTTSTIATSCEATIPVSVDNITVNKKFTFAVAIKGAQGIQGIQGPKGDQGIAGPRGEQGATGAAGKTSYFHIKYSSVSNPTQSSQMTESPSTYIGTYVDFIQADSTDPAAYTWSRFEGIKGDQGIPGTNGSNGKTSYLHIAYANNSTGTSGFSTTDSTGKMYIGQYTDFVQADSTDPAKYSWTKIKGETGATGPQGNTGAAGQDAITVTITSSNGTIFKNNSGSTVLTAHVYKGAVEQSITDAGVCGSLGSIKWYKQGSATAVKTSKTLSVTAAEVVNSVVYTAQLEQ